MDQVRFGLIGCGNFGSKRAKAFREINTARLACVVDVNEERAKTLAAINGSSYYTDYIKALTCEQLDCVIVATPNITHAKTSIDAMSLGKHVICEKPLATSVDDAELMVWTSKEKGVNLKVGSNLRYFPNVINAKKIIDEDKIGNTIFLRGWIGNAGNHLNGSWFSKPEIAGGGTLLDNGHHIIDLSSWFLGNLSFAAGYVCTLFQNVSSEDNAVAVLKTESGSFALIQSSWTEWNGYTYIEVYGQKGSLVIDCRDGKNQLVLRDKANNKQEYNFDNNGPSSYALEIADFADAIRHNREIRPSGLDGLHILQLIKQIYLSTNVNIPISIPA
jgi:predicted dehydrogenase